MSYHPHHAMGQTQFQGFIQIENLWVLPIVQVLRLGAIEDLQSSYRKPLIKSLRALFMRITM
jgi:hypothetical protein